MLFGAQVGKEGHVPGADLVIPNFHHLPQVLPELFTNVKSDVLEVPEAGVPVSVMAS